MKKRDILLVLCLLIISLSVLAFGLYRRNETNAKASRVASDTEEEAETPVYSEHVLDLAKKYLDDYPAQSYLLIMTNTLSYLPIPLSEENSFKITQPDGSENVIHIGKDSFFMESSNCDNQLCVEEGEVTLENMDSRVLLNMVYCLPHNLSLGMLTPEETEEVLREMYSQKEAYEAYLESQNNIDDTGDVK